MPGSACDCCLSVTSSGHKEGGHAQRRLHERAPGQRRSFRPWGKDECSDLLIQCFFPRRRGTDSGGARQGDAAERWMERDIQGEQSRWKWLQNLWLGLTPGSNEVQEQVSHRGKDTSFTEAVLHKHLHSRRLLNLCCSHGKKLKEGYLQGWFE